MSVTDGHSRSDPARAVPPADRLPLRELLRVLWRRRRAVLWVVAVTTAVATLVGLHRDTTYTATSLVMIQPQESRIVDLEQVAQGLSADAAGLETQMRFIRSHENLARTVEHLEVAADPSLLFPDDDPSPLTALLPDTWLIAAGAAKSSTPMAEKAMPPAIAGEESRSAGRVVEEAKSPPANEGENRQGLRGLAVGALRDGLEISQSGRSHIFTISYTSRDPRKAAQIANGVARAYVEGQLGRKLEQTWQARSWLAERVEELRRRVLESERAVADYRAAHGQLEGQGFALDSRQMAALTTQLIDVRGEHSAEQAKLRRVRQLRERGDYALLGDTVSSPLITRLRQDELALARQEAELSREYGPRHPRIKQLEAEQARVAKSIERAIDSAIHDLETEVEAGRAREQAFYESLQEAKGRSMRIGQAEVQLRELEREAKANRALYEDFLVRLKKTEEQQQIVEPDARVISPASVPAAPSSPSPFLFAFVGLSGSLVVGSFLALFLEHLDTSLRSGRQVEELGVAALGLVPGVRNAHGSLRDHFLSKPGSAYAEGVRALYTRVRGDDLERAPKVVLVTSALPDEGKTSLAGGLAMCAAQLQQKVLLLDLDLRQPALGECFGLGSGLGMRALVDGHTRLEDVVQRDHASGVDVLAPARHHDNPAALLAAQRLRPLLDEARERYDCIVVDGAPVLGVADAKMLARVVDTVLFVIRWERTKRDAARSALQELGDVPANVAGAVLNNVDMKRHAYYAYGDSGQYYPKYKRYYQN